MHSRSDSYLKRLFNEFNRLYWDGRLPQDTIVRWAPTSELTFAPNKSAWGICYPPQEGDPGLILLDREMQRRKWGATRDFTLLHEMAHLAKPRSGHGPEFEREMLRLAVLGAFKGLW